MIELAQTSPYMPQYSDTLYHMAVVMPFRSRSSYNFMHWYFLIPVPGPAYHRFREQIAATITLLKSIDERELCLASRIDVHARIAEGAVLAVDAVSCAKTFVGMRQVEEGHVAYLFVVYLQPLTPEAKCSPLFIIESEVGLANDGIQQKIDEAVEITWRRIGWVFLASDGDPSYDDRHHEFMAFWEPIYQEWGLEKGAGGAERVSGNSTAQRLAAPRQELTDALSEVLVDVRPREPQQNHRSQQDASTSWFGSPTH
jgi:hypothetical protein